MYLWKTEAGRGDEKSQAQGCLIYCLEGRTEALTSAALTGSPGAVQTRGGCGI
jgi:hypothetical protein